MALHEFIEAHREPILNRTREVIRRATNKGGTQEQVIDSLPELLEDIVAQLRADVGLSRETQPTQPGKTATNHAVQRWHLGFTITELVHDYGALCNAITSLAEECSDITPHEYQLLNEVLDVAIAAAVSEFSERQQHESEQQADKRATQHLGFVAHELRNAISAAILAFDAVRRGQVAIGGRTSNVLERNLVRLKLLVDRSLTDVRLKSGVALAREPTNFGQLLEEVEASAVVEAKAKSDRIVVDADPSLEGMVDRQTMISAVSNLVYNAIKYSPPGAEIHVRCGRCGEAGGGVDIEVEDECGGLPDDKGDQLFSPFVRGTTGGGGLGLGLTIARQAVEAHGGRIEARSLPGKGCVFVVHLPGV